MMQEYTIREMAPGVRCRWVYDEHYETRGSYAYGSEAEDKEAEEWELERLRDGRLVALGCIVERECRAYERHEMLGVVPNTVQRYTHWHETDALWGIVIEPNDAKLDEFAHECLDLGKGA